MKRRRKTAFGNYRSISSNPMEKAGRSVEKAFENCYDHRGMAVWQNNRWWIDTGKRVFAVLDAAPGCRNSGVDFTQVKGNGLGKRKRRVR